MRPTVTAALATAILFLAGCSSVTSGVPKAATSTRTLDAPAGQIVFQLRIGGGFVPQEYTLAARPGLTIYANGDAYRLRTARASGSPAQGMFERGSVPLETLRGLVRDADRSGLFAGVEFGAPQITDLASTQVTFRPDGEPVGTASAYALGYGDETVGLTAVQKNRRFALRAFVKRLFDSVVALDGGPDTWTPSRVDVTRFGDGRGGAPVRWPGPALTTVFSKPSAIRDCGVLDGAAARRVWTAALAARTTSWSDGGRTYSLIIRALLPGEASCIP